MILTSAFLFAILKFDNLLHDYVRIEIQVVQFPDVGTYKSH